MRERLRRSLLGAGLAALACLLVVAPASATIREVQNNNDAGAGSLRAIVAISADTDIITFKPGVADHPVLNSGNEIDVPVDLTITGNGVGTTTVDANGFGRIFSVSGTGSLALEDLTLTQGQAPSGMFGAIDGTPGESGGAIFAAGGTGLSLTRVAITDSHAGAGGNGGTGDGGLGGSGGAISTGAALTTITDSTLSGNGAGQGGGGGTDGRGGGLGGAVFVSPSGSLTLRRSTLTDNDAGDGGLGGSGVGGDGGNGGAVYASGAFFNSENSTIFDNRSGTANTGGGGNGEDGHGGGVSDSSLASGTLTSTTVAGNSSGTETGGGLFGGGGAPLLVRNSIIASNLGDPGDENCDGNITDSGHNIEFQTGGGCPNTFGAGDPQLAGSLASNGGLTRTLAIGATSAARNIVPTIDCLTVLVPAPLTIDQRGAPRPQSGACDAGAYEICTTAGGAFPECPPAPPAATPFPNSPLVLPIVAATPAPKKCKKGRKLKKGKCVKKKRK